MQIDGGKNDLFAAYGDSGGLVMGHYDGSKLPLWQIAKKYVLADNFFMGGVRRLVPQSFRTDLRLRAGLSECRPKPGQRLRFPSSTRMVSR